MHEQLSKWSEKTQAEAEVTENGRAPAAERDQTVVGVVDPTPTTASPLRRPETMLTCVEIVIRAPFINIPAHIV